MNTSVLFIIFNRPDTTAKVFEKIKQAQPPRLYIAADGPRQKKIGEEMLCLASRKVVEDNITWKCEVNTFFRAENAGCKLAVSSAISWFFENEEQGIILEDDCLPDLSFFNYCEVLLEKYRKEKKIMHIGGTNFLDGSTAIEGSYYFSKLIHVWGWATWKRAWQLYDLQMKQLPALLKNFEGVTTDKKQIKYWKKKFNLVKDNKLDTWDYQWVYSVLVNNGLGITPAVNLVSNIGFRGDATHTVLKNDKMADRTTTAILSLAHSQDMEQNAAADAFEMSNLVKSERIFKRLVLSVFLKLIRIISVLGKKNDATRFIKRL